MHDNWTDEESTKLLKEVLFHKCPKCGREMLEINRKAANDTWHRIGWVCWKCGHEEKVKP